MMNQITRVKPSPMLQQIVKHFWFANIQADLSQGARCRILADGLPGFIFQHNNGRSAISEANGRALLLAFIYGQGIEPCINIIKGNAFIVGGSFHTTALKQFFGIDADVCTNVLVEADHVFDEPVLEQLLHAPGPFAVIALLESRLIKHMSAYKPHRLIEATLNHIAYHINHVRPESLPLHFNISSRQLQRKFKQHTGVSPETYIRILKFQRSLHLLTMGQYEKLSDIGYQLNYADQSHFIREFKYFSGITPRDFLQQNDIRPILPVAGKRFEPLRLITA